MYKTSALLYDALVLILILALAMTVLAHLCSDSGHEDEILCAVMLLTERTRGEIRAGDEATSFGSLPIKIVAISQKRILAVCRGRMWRGGFLAGGTKYVLKNQPVTLLGKGFSAYCRAERIIPLASAGLNTP